MRRASALALVLAAVLACIATATEARRRAPDAAPLRGKPLDPGSGLRLVVADDPPLLLDVDSGAVARVGVARARRGTLHVVAVGGRGAVAISRAGPASQAYGIRGRHARVTRLGRGDVAWPHRGARAAWILTRERRSRCRLRLVSLDGRLLRRARPFPCATVSDPAAGLLGLVVRRTRVVEPESGRTVLRSQVAILAVAGRRLLLRAGRRALMLIDNETGRKRAVPWPSALEGLDDAVVDPGGRFVALSFAAPSWPGGKQVMDAWLLDTQTGRLAQLPAMPAFVALKATSLAWRADGQLVLLGEDERRQFVALWRPGQRRLAFKLVRFPKRRGDSDSFAPLG